ncbi:MAG: PhzF family phenazine biosynthesis protein [Candidatus Marinimicrobia bacterium]|nr:PhzF family phenazine biosynthesis protein [Candidatus Neomarinimicrobiota bacterium]
MKRNKTIYQVDSFTDTPFKGNPAGVMIVDKDCDSAWMQNIAMEMNLSETAFVLPNEQYFEIRYFTPIKEVPLCGHATLASAHIIFELGLVNLSDTIYFKAKGGHLSVKKDVDWLVMNFPQYPLLLMDTPKGFQDIVGFSPIETFKSSDDWIIAIADSETAILEANPNFENLNAGGLGHLMITAQSRLPEADFVVRCFAPASGINEDPVTGSAHCALTPLWSEKLGKFEMDSIQLSKRTGKLRVKIIHDRVEIKGKAITIFKAELQI